MLQGNNSYTGEVYIGLTHGKGCLTGYDKAGNRIFTDEGFFYNGTDAGLGE